MTRQMLPVSAGLFLLWVAFVLLATSARGPGLCPDSMSYLAAAESMARGVGPEVPVAEWSQSESQSRLRHFPPLFPALIAVAMTLGLPAAQAARWLEAFAAGTLALLLAWIAVSCVGRARARAAALATGLGVLLAPAISLSFFMVLSEPVFLMFWALTLLLMLRAPAASVALGCCAACCALTRYAGVSVTAAVVLWMLWQHGTWRLRCMRALITATPTLAGLAAWRVWSGREFRHYAWYLDGFAANLQEAWDTLRDSLVPIPQTIALQPAQVAASVVVALLATWLLLRAAQHAAVAGDHDAAVTFAALWRAASLMAGTYLGVLVASRLRADPEIPFDWRLLSPVILSGQLTLSVALVRQWDGLRSRAWRICAGTLACAWLGAASWNAAHNVVVMQRDGACYDAPDWQDSAFARWLRSTGRRYALYSNNPAPLWHLDHRSSWLLPEPAADRATLAALLERLHTRAQPAAVLGFRAAFVATAQPKVLADRLGLSSEQCFEQVCVWTAPGSTSTETSEQAIVHAP
jgi:hypothetical protein